MFIIQTTVDQKAMTALARVSRKTLRRGRSGPVRTLAWFIVVLEAFLTATYLRGGEDGWQVNALLGLFMLGCILGEDWVNGAVGLRKVPPGSREVNAAFKDDQIRAAAETKDYFVLLLGRSQGQVYDKKGFSWGEPEEFREFIHKKTGLKVQYIK